MNSLTEKMKPLFWDDNKLIYSKYNKVYSREPGKNDILLFEFPVSKIKKMLNSNGLIYRLLRSGVGASAKFKDNYYFVFNKGIYRYQISKKTLTKEYEFVLGRGPLQFTVVENLAGFSDSIIFGEYFGNHERNIVNIMRRNENGCWSEIYTFPRGELNHIHALVPDYDRGKIWVLSGDFGHSASIYQASSNFKKVKPILVGSQKYRACVAFPYKNGLLYATDTQMESNSIRFMTCSGGQWSSEKILDINGSCIYGTELKDYFVFSTSTEPSEKNNSRISRLLDNKPAPGILKNKSDIISFRKKDAKIEIVASFEKDIWPYRLFQFGGVMFPSYSDRNNVLYSYLVASKNNDLSTAKYNLDNL
ncbi:hypothetical protein [Vibrio sp. THAF190c]|uniref:hypothetical protein n=1 Tax=Vibrio sp. THAF190c TaxID=2587865 RepID=UPI001267A42E|nr:hypothetical protein [Vibrio sp. THAF190c]QFT08595.1 hypothetical protein FIV04_01040 [Vibrio sp. THAF190c]